VQEEAAVVARLPLAGGAAAGALDLAPDLAAPRSAADQAADAAALLAARADGRWAAVTCRRTVHVVDLVGLRHHAVLPPLQARRPRARS